MLVSPSSSPEPELASAPSPSPSAPPSYPLRGSVVAGTGLYRIDTHGARDLTPELLKEVRGKFFFPFSFFPLDIFCFFFAQKEKISTPEKNKMKMKIKKTDPSSP